MRLWTVQPEAVYELIVNAGVYRCAPDKSDWYHFNDNFNFAYRYMADKLAAKTGEPAVLPVWAWHTVNRKHAWPEPEEIGADNQECEYVIMEIEIDDDKVLLSSRDKWNGVIGHNYVYAGLTDDELDEEDEYLDSLDDEAARELIESSFDRAFDISHTDVYSDDTQAVFAELRKENIIEVRHYKPTLDC